MRRHSRCSPADRRSRNRFSLVLMALVLFLPGLQGVTGCSTGEKGNAVPKAPIPVIVTAAVEKDVQETIETIGSVEAHDTVSIRSRIGGALMRVAFAEGQEVRQGDLLFVIDPRPYQEALQAALAALNRDQALAANAERDAARYAELLKEEYVSKQQYDQVMTTAQALRDTVRSDEAAVENARLNLRYCDILAPMSGQTGVQLVHEGDQIKADDTALVTINRITPIKVSFSVPERRLPEIRRYASAGSLKVEARLPDGTGRPAAGKLTFINNAVDTATGTILLKATFPNADKRLWPGQFTDVTLTLTTRPHVVVIPTQAVQTGQKGPFVFVIKSDLTAESRSVEPGQEIDGLTVIEKGLKAGENVASDGQLGLVPGAKVQVQRNLDAGGAVTP